MYRAYKYRLYPDKEQSAMFAKTFGCCRKVWNLMLADKIRIYEETGKIETVTPARYKKEYPYLKEVDSLALCNKQLDLEDAFRNYFKKSGRIRRGFPKFKSAKKTRKSYTTNKNGNSNNLSLQEHSIRLPKIGVVKAVIHRRPDESWKLKSATISQEADGTYYAALLFEYEAPVITHVIDTDSAIGLDYTSGGLYKDHNGNTGTNHKYFRESQKKLAREQRRLAGKVGSRKGETQSANYKKQLRRVNKIHRHVANQRLDNLHKLSTAIAKQYDIVCVEDLNMTEVLHTLPYRRYHKAALDNGFGMFRDLLEYKMEERGGIFIRVPKDYPSSQICHNCGMLHEEMKDISVRKIRCGCGHVMDRDRNAALNILKKGLSMLQKGA